MRLAIPLVMILSMLGHATAKPELTMHRVQIQDVGVVEIGHRATPCRLRAENGGRCHRGQRP
jgi:hypothetical protein